MTRHTQFGLLMTLSSCAFAYGKSRQIIYILRLFEGGSLVSNICFLGMRIECQFAVKERETKTQVA